MKTSTYALIYLLSIAGNLFQVTFGQGKSGGKGNDFSNSGKGQGQHLDTHDRNIKNKNRWDKDKWSYRCAHKSTMTSINPNFGSKDQDNVEDVFVKHTKCSKVNDKIASIPAQCSWFPSICPDETLYIEGQRKNITNGQPWFEFRCCINKLGCKADCEDHSEQLKTNQVVNFFGSIMESDDRAYALTSVFYHDMSAGGQATVDWKICRNVTLCYTPPPGPPPKDRGCPECAALAALAALAAIGSGKPSSSSAAPATTAAG